MLHEYVATGLRDPDAPLSAASLAAVFVRCLVISAALSIATGLAISIVLDRLG
jgi:hypothetical protein